MSDRHPIWYGVGFSLTPFLALLLGYLNIHPEFYRGVPGGFGGSMDASVASIAWGEDDAKDPPLEYVSDKFQGVEVWTEVLVVESFWSLWNRPQSELEYRWEYTVKNLSPDKRNITVTYELESSEEVVLKSSIASGVAESGETITIKGQDRMKYFEARLVVQSGWRIRHTIER